MTEEIFKEIPNFDEYLISNFRRVKSFKKNKNGKILKYSLVDGYYVVYLTNIYGKIITKRIHRLLAELFIENPDNLSNVDHIDCDRLNNDLSNLCWCTHAQNQFNKNKQKIKTSSQYKGVTWNKKANKWIAQVMFEKKNYYLGCYASEIEAVLAYNQTA